MTITLCAFNVFAVDLISLRGFWSKTFSYVDSPNLVVILEKSAYGNSFTSVDHSMFSVVFVFYSP